jgi:hypothetical protein
VLCAGCTLQRQAAECIDLDQPGRVYPVNKQAIAYDAELLVVLRCDCRVPSLARCSRSQLGRRTSLAAVAAHSSATAGTSGEQSR